MTEHLRTFRYTLVAYRPNGYESFRNCITARSDSAFELVVCDSPEHAAMEWAKKMYADRRSPPEESGWEITLLVNGQDESAFDSDELNDDVPCPFEAIQGLAKTKLGELLDADAARERLRKEHEAAAAVLQAQEAAAAKERAERRQYEKLHQKFGPPRKV